MLKCAQRLAVYALKRPAAQNEQLDTKETRGTHLQHRMNNWGTICAAGAPYIHGGVVRDQEHCASDRGDTG